MFGLWLWLLVCVPIASSAGGSVPVPQSLRAPLLEISSSAAESLRTQSYDAAFETLHGEGVTTRTGAEKSHAAFVLAYALVRADRAQEAAQYLSILPTDGSIPQSYLSYVVGAVAYESDDMRKADVAFQSVDVRAAIYPRAALLHAQVLLSLGRTKDAYQVYQSLVDGPRSSEGGAVAMLALANRAGAGSPEARALMRRIWTEHPFSTAAVKIQSALKPEAVKWTVREQSLRVEQLMLASSYVQAVSEGQAALSILDSKSADSSDICRLRYATGRSQYKRKARTKSVTTFGDIGKTCEKALPDFGAKGLYLQGMAHFKAGRYAASVPYFVEIPKRFPTHSYADDGYALAASAMLEVGDVEGATALVENAILQTPDGDTTPSALVKVAFANYRAGNTALALSLVDKGASLPLTGDWVHVAGAQYWAARWRLYSDAKSPSSITTDTTSLLAGKQRLFSLVKDLPWSYYSLLAMGRLIEIAPSMVSDIDRTGQRADLSKPWLVRSALLEDTGFMRGVALARLGLVVEAMAEWRLSKHSAQTPQEFAWVNELREMGGDWHAAHMAARRSIRGLAPTALGEARPEVLRSVYPDRYWQEVREATAEYKFEPRFFHALIREESTFNAEVVSWAGAIGLSQVMPPTAKDVAKGLGIPYDKARLVEPAYNLSLGASYLDEVLGRFGGSPYLALAAYNAGPHRVHTWTKRYGVIPTDEFVELIPFKETRGYVKRVMGSWQLMAWEFDSSVPLPDLSRYNHKHLRSTD